VNESHDADKTSLFDHWFADIARFVEEESVAELGVVAVGVGQGVGPVGRGQFGVGDRVREPAVVGWRAILRTRDVTATGIRSAASSRTSG